MTLHPFLIKRGNVTGYNGFKRITGTKMHAAVESNGFPISILLSPANEHDSTKCIDVTGSISDYLDDDSIQQIEPVYADKMMQNTSECVCGIEILHIASHTK